jgi:DNA topoisomerase-1
MKLFIVESPNKCNKLKSFLGSEWKVAASVGHIREIPKKSMNIDIKNGFVPTFEVSNDKKDVVRDLKKLADEADQIILATDPDSEGEAIAWHIYDVFSDKNKKKCKRATFVEITKKAVLDAIAKPRDIDMNKVDAQKARQVLDRLIGFKVSPVLWYKAHINGSSAGRVQSIALKIVCDRQKEIDAFKPEDYWFVEAFLKCKKGEFWAKVITKEKDNRYTEEKIAKEDLEKLQKATYQIDKIDRSEKKNNAPAPFDTNSLQVTCASVFGWSLSKSQTLAQKLYEQGKVTYIRTDSFNIAEEALKEVRDFIKDGYSEPYLPKTANTYSKKAAAAAQEAHECIRPTHIKDEGDDISDEGEKKMYELIRARFIAGQMTPQIVDTVAYDIKASSGHHLIARGQTIKFDGWAKAYKYSKTKEEVLPGVEDKENLELKEVKKTKHTTQPPARYNEGSLAKAMEKEGVGRPATRATIITSIQKKGYVEKDKKSKGLVATILGMRIYDYLQPHFGDFFMDIKYTSTLEDDLDEIRDSKKNYLGVVSSVYEILQKHIKELGEGDMDKKEQETTGKKCPVCKDGEIVEKDGKYGKFFSCTGYPKCKTVFTKDDDGEFKVKEKKEFKTTGKKCPECEKNGRNGELVERKNKSNGSLFYGCEKYPTCRHSEPIDGEIKSNIKYQKRDKSEPEDRDLTEINLSIGDDENNE